MTTATAAFAAPQQEAAARDPRRGALALALQEAFTAAVRLRANRQVATDSAAFRAHAKRLLAAADAAARQAGYDGADVKLAVYAYVAFLDESVLNSRQPMFADWPRQPLQEEVFGDHMAGETFFLYLRELLGRQDSSDLADLLEVFELCLLLGFRGRYAAGHSGEVDSLIAATDEKIRRIRGSDEPLSPAWMPPPGERAPVAHDPWLGRIAALAGGLALVALLLFVGFSLSLRGAVGTVRQEAAQVTR